MLDTLMQQFRNALKANGARDVEQWSYYAYALHNLPHVPPQLPHQDYGKGRDRSAYFTDLIPVSVDAEPTEFGWTSPFLTFLGPVMFGGNVWHRGPGVGANARIVLSLVACKNGLDANHDSATPYPWPCREVVYQCGSANSLLDFRVSAAAPCGKLDARMLQDTALWSTPSSGPVEAVLSRATDLRIPCPVVDLTAEAECDATSFVDAPKLPTMTTPLAVELDEIPQATRPCSVELVNELPTVVVMSVKPKNVLDQTNELIRTTQPGPFCCPNLSASEDAQCSLQAEPGIKSSALCLTPGVDWTAEQALSSRPNPIDMCILGILQYAKYAKYTN
jgi:hypothetical protein